MKVKHRKGDRRRSRRRGQSLIETLVGLSILIPLALFAVDIVALINGSHLNEEWAETAAKAAARQNDSRMAREIAEQAIMQVPLSAVVQSVRVDEVKFDPTEGHVRVTTLMDVKLPISFPNFEVVTFRHESIQPIVSTRAPI